jgi:hypothetical protein
VPIYNNIPLIYAATSPLFPTVISLSISPPY